MGNQLLTLEHATEAAKLHCKSTKRDWDAEQGPMQASIARHVLAVARCVTCDGATIGNLTELEQGYAKAWLDYMKANGCKLVSVNVDGTQMPALEEVEAKAKAPVKGK